MAAFSVLLWLLKCPYLHNSLLEFRCSVKFTAQLYLAWYLYNSTSRQKFLTSYFGTFVTPSEICFWIIIKYSLFRNPCLTAWNIYFIYLPKQLKPSKWFFESPKIARMFLPTRLAMPSMVQENCFTCRFAVVHKIMSRYILEVQRQIMYNFTITHVRNYQ